MGEGEGDGEGNGDGAETGDSFCASARGSSPTVRESVSVEGSRQRTANRKVIIEQVVSLRPSAFADINASLA